MDKERIVIIFFLTWLVLGVVSLYLFFINKNAAFKRTIFPWFVILVGMLFLSFLILLDGPRRDLLFMIPLIALISFLNIYRTRFCDACGKTVHNYRGLGRPRQCSKCGSMLV